MTHKERQSFNEQQKKNTLASGHWTGTNTEKKGGGVIIPAQTKHMNEVSKYTALLEITSMIYYKE